MKNFVWPRRAVLSLPLVTAAQTRRSAPEANPPFDRFGGLTRIALHATGHFRVQKLGSRWIFVTPEGHPFFALGVNHIGKFLSDPKQSSTFHARFHAQPAAATEFLRAALASLNFNAAEAFRPLAPEITRLYPHVEDITYPANEKYRFDIFDPDTRGALVEHVRQQAVGFAQDPMVIGAGFADQPVWTTPRMDYFRSLAADARGRDVYTRWLLARHKQPETLRRLYGLPSTLDDALRVPIKAAKGEPQIKLDDEAFLGQIADAVYAALKEGVQAGAPGKLLFSEKFVLRASPRPVLESVAKYSDVFLTQALILSKHRPPEWQVFQPEGYRQEHAWLGGKPMLIVDWTAPYSMAESLETEHGTLKPEAEASREAARWLWHAVREPYIAGIFLCQLAGTHVNDKFFPPGRMKRTFLRDDGSPTAFRTSIFSRANAAALRYVYSDLKAPKL